MQLPAEVRAIVDDALKDLSTQELAAAQEYLSGQYRSNATTKSFHLSEEILAKAYLAARLPATYAASYAALSAVTARLQDFQPQSLLDVGAGPASATLAALRHWQSIRQVTLLEGSALIQRWGERLLAPLTPLTSTWLLTDLRVDLPDLASHNLVILAYVLNELTADMRRSLVDQLWSRTRGVLVIVEPGTPAGYDRLLAVRSQLLQLKAQLVAPCPHAKVCPLTGTDWCHFSVRVARSRVHRLSKQGELGYEDEKYCYLALTRHPVVGAPARILAPPRNRSKLVQLKLCMPGGELKEHTITKRDGALYQRAKRLDWGDTFEG